MRPWAAEASAGASGGPWGLQLKGGPEVTQGPSAGTCDPPLTTGDSPSGHPAAQLAAAVLLVCPLQSWGCRSGLWGVSPQPTCSWATHPALDAAPPQSHTQPSPHLPWPSSAVPSTGRPPQTPSSSALICGPQHQPSPPRLRLHRPSSVVPSTSSPGRESAWSPSPFVSSPASSSPGLGLLCPLTHPRPPEGRRDLVCEAFLRLIRAPLPQGQGDAAQRGGP